MRGREVLPVQQHIGQLGLHGVDEVIDELVVVLVIDPAMAPAEIHRVVEQLGVVGADVKHHRQRPRGVDPAERGVQRQLADWDSHPAEALVAQPEHALPVGDDDDVDVVVGTVAQYLGDPVAIGVRDEQPTRPAVDLAEPLRCDADRRRVDDRQHLLDVRAQQFVEQNLVVVLQRPEVDVLGDVGRLLGERTVGTCHLLFERLDRGGQQPP